MKRFISSLFINLVLIFIIAPDTQAAGVISSELQSVIKSEEQGEIPVIITLSDKVDFKVFKDLNKSLRRSRMIKEFKSKADVSQRPLKAFLESKGARKLKSLWVINGMAATVRADAIEELASQSGVEDMRLDAVIYAPQVIYETLALPEWNIEMIQAPELWNLGHKGAGIAVASMDTGVDINHPDLNIKWRGGTNSWFDPNGQHSSPYDANGHGTQTMGIIVGGDAGGTVIGVAPDAKWISVKIFNDADEASFSAIHQGFQWLLDPDDNPDTDDLPDIVNNSWGLDTVNKCSLEFQPDIQVLKTAGIAVVFSAGNSGPYASTSKSPANNPESFSVGAVDSSLTIASFSSRGPSSCDGSIYPEIVAPGVNVRTSDLTFGGVFPNSYASVSGTSIAAPHISGAMALLMSAFPQLEISELEAALEQSALDLGIPGEDNDYGSGLVDVMEAYNFINHVPDIEVTPASQDFGVVEIGTVSAANTFTVTNNGVSELIIGAISIAGPNPGEFQIVSDNCSEEIVGPSSECSIEVIFSPSSSGSLNANVTILSNDPDTPTQDISLHGIGIQSSYDKVTVVVPNGSEVIPSGSAYVIWWGAPVSAEKFKLMLSRDSGQTWKPLKTETEFVNGKSYLWQVPVPLGNERQCIIKVSGYTMNGEKIGADISNAPFRIEVVKLASPDGGETLRSHDTQDIVWRTNETKKPVAKTKVWYSKDGGANWIKIAALAGNPGSYSWKVPMAKNIKHNVRVKVELVDEFGNILGKDASDGFFKILPLSQLR